MNSKTQAPMVATISLPINPRHEPERHPTAGENADGSHQPSAT